MGACLQGDQRFPDYAGRNFAEIGQLTGGDPWDVYFDILVAAGAEMESIQFVGMLFTDAHLAEMIRHPLFSLTADTWSSRIDGPLADQSRHTICFAGHIHFLTHHTRALGTLSLDWLTASTPAAGPGGSCSVTGDQRFGLTPHPLVRRGLINSPPGARQTGLPNGTVGGTASPRAGRGLG